jgi:radical SAM superfamily enzyme YgiQ (UPF0313 family)
MKILLINPSFTGIYGNFAPAARVGVLWPPMGLAYLASNIKGHDVKILDLEINPDLDGTLKEFNPDIVGITFTTPLYNQAMDLFKHIKELNPDIHTIAGGPHPTTLPDSVISSEYIDTVMVGEGEVAINKFLDNPTKGVLTREPLIQDLDTIKFPARYLLENEKYLFSVPGKGIVPLTSFMSSRGCPFMCTFCSQHLMFGRKMRYRSIENCIDELKQIKKMGINHVSMLDDTLGLDKERTYKLCDRIIEEDLDITFEGYTRVNIITEELLKKLKKAGLVRLSFGVESGNQEILNAIKKGINLEQIRKAYEITDKMGIETRMSIIFGLPGETEKTIKKTIKFMKSLKCSQAYVNVATPFPGTELYENAESGMGGMKLLTKDWKEYRRWGNAVINVNDLSAKDLIKWQRRALLEFYLRPKQIYYNLKRAGLRAAFKNGISFFKSFIK